MTAPAGGNVLYYGDNLDVLRRHVKDETVDLVYLDPPFQSGKDYNVLFAEHSGERSASQIKAFEDTWRWDLGAEAAYREAVEAGGKVSDAMRAMRTFLGESDMMAYLAMMAPRLVELRRALRPTGSIYLHCDPTASHYLKMLMDAVFGAAGFVNEIVWQRTNVHNDAKRWSPVSDSLLFFAKGRTFTWNPQYAPLSEAHVASKYRNMDGDGRRYTLSDMRSPNPRPNLMYEWKGHKPHPNGWAYSRETMERLDREGRIWYPDSKDKRPRLKRYLDGSPGTVLGNVWTDIDPINAMAAERLGYPTQKPEALLERILLASSNEGDAVLDPFCGCGTAVAVANRLRRRWTGIDITHLAIGLIKHRLRDSQGAEAGRDYSVVGEPTDAGGAAALAAEDPYQFQWWILGLVGARPSEQKKGADKGIDGRLFFHDEPHGGETKQIVISVKAGKNIGVAMVHELRGVMEREGAAIGVLLSMEEPTKPMRTDAASAGFYASPWGRHPRLQLLTVADLLAGRRIDYPPSRQTNVTFKRAPEAAAAVAEAPGLFEPTPAAAEPDAEHEDAAADETGGAPLPHAPPAPKKKRKAR